MSALSHITFRQAGEADVETVLRLKSIVARNSRAADLVPAGFELDWLVAAMADLLDCGPFAVSSYMLAVVGGIVAGAVCVNWFSSLRRSSRSAPAGEFDELLALSPRSLFLSDLAVFEEFRNRGVALRLLELVEQTARSLGLRRIALLVAEDNEAAVALYSKYGFMRKAARRGSRWSFGREDASAGPVMLLMTKAVPRAAHPLATA